MKHPGIEPTPGFTGHSIFRGTQCQVLCLAAARVACRSLYSIVLPLWLYSSVRHPDSGAFQIPGGGFFAIWVEMSA